MTFDELWRLNLARRSGSAPSEQRVEVGQHDDAASAVADEAEVNRFLEWLEQSLV